MHISIAKKISSVDTEGKHYYCHHIESRVWASGIFIFGVGPFRKLQSRSCTFRLWISYKRSEIGQTLLLPSFMNSRTDFQSEYLHLSLDRSKGQVKIMHIFIVNISEVVPEWASATTAIQSNQHNYVHSIMFDTGPFMVGFSAGSEINESVELISWTRGRSIPSFTSAQLNQSYD